MHPRLGQSGRGHHDELGDAMPRAREGARSDRMREIRRRIADDAYRAPEVVEEIARRILMSREL